MPDKRMAWGNRADSYAQASFFDGTWWVSTWPKPRRGGMADGHTHVGTFENAVKRMREDGYEVEEA